MRCPAALLRLGASPVSWDGTTNLGQTLVDSNDNFVYTFLVPSNAGIGSHNIYFTQQFTGGGAGTFWIVPFTVTASPTPTPSPTVTPACNHGVTPPTISSVSGQILPSAIGWSITINGTCFGNVFPTVYTQSDGSVTTQPSTITLEIVLVNQGTSGTVPNWGAGFGNDLIGIYLASWTDNAITINGFGSSYVPSRYGIASGDQIFIYIGGPNCQASTTPQWPTISNPPPPSVWPSNCLSFTSTTVSTPTPTFNISGFKMNVTGSGVQDWNITLANSTMQKIVPTGADGSYKFTGLVSGTYNVTEETQVGWTNVSPSSQQVTINGADMPDINFTNLKIPVILVHGWMSLSTDTAWANTMNTMFTNAGFIVEVFTYEGKNQDINDSADDLRTEIYNVKNKYNSAKVDIVGHSEGGIVARAYINNPSLYQNDVRKLVMIGSPNHGTDLNPLNFTGIAASQMESHNSFLKWLNGNDNCVDLQPESDRDDFKSVHYYTIGSHTPSTLPLTVIHKHMKVFNYDVTYPSSTTDGDGLTGDSSLNLSGVLPNDIAIIPDVIHADLPKVFQIDITRTLHLISQLESKAVIDRAISDIRGDASSSATTVASSSATTDNVATQLSSAAQGVIKPNETKTHIIFNDNTTKREYFSLFWGGSNIDLVLYTPSGAKIDSSVTLNNPNINYTSGAIFKSYIVESPESGNWTMEVTAINVTSTGENYSAMTFMETNLFVGAGTDKDSYTPNAPITVAAYVQNNGTPISNVNVTATISRPDGTNSTIQLYDDGLHNDNQTNDGLYANVYTDTNLGGEYTITTTADGIIGNESFERKAFKNVWVELYPDLTITSSDINFSNDIPIPGENITINATIHNIGDADANNSSILFYDGDPASGVLIAENKINVSAGQTARASSSWNTTAGQHEIYVLISPFNEFQEKNYSNNKASKLINVIPTEGKPKGDLNNNGVPADAGDLVLMKRASIGEIQADSSYDLNNNGQFADAGDLVLMKRASIGEVNL